MMKVQSMGSLKGVMDQQPIVQDLDHLRKMFIGGLSAVTNEDSLRAFYAQWGEVVDAVVMRDPSTKRSRGFGFITYSDPTMVDAAQASRPHVIDGKTVDSKRALPRPEAGRSDGSNSVKKIFVGGLKEIHDETTLSEHFSQFGNVVSVKILTDKATGRKRGFAFIEFDDYDAVDKAVLHKNHTIKYVLVDVKKSVYKHEFAKKQQQQQQGAAGGNITPQSNAGYALQTGAYPPPNYGYAPYNSWTGYAPTGYAPAQQMQPMTGYGGYAPAPVNGVMSWNGTYAAGPPAWPQNGYAAPNGAASVQSPAGGTAASANGWGAATTAAPVQNFGDYQQTYNGGPQKTGSLQNNRVNPYSVSTAANYGDIAAGILYYHKFKKTYQF